MSKHMTEQELLARDDPSVFIGSVALMDALYESYLGHIGVAELDGPQDPYMWCVCGWRSDDLDNSNPGNSYAIHLSNAQHAAAVIALQPIVRRVQAGSES